MARILFLSLKDYSRPSGGIRTIFRHIEALRRNGFDAALVKADQSLMPRWFEYDVPMLDSSRGLSLLPDDHVVIPEIAEVFFRQLRTSRARRYVFNQNHFYTYRPFPDAAEAYREYGVHQVLACSHQVKAFVEDFLGYRDVPVVPPVVDARFFQDRPKRLQIAYMPRKRGEDAAFIRRTLAYAFPETRDVPWVPIADKTEAEVAEILAESALFLSMNHREGLGLPPLEAMAAGCLVVGFRGGGGRDYARPDNGIWLDDDEDLPGCIHALRRAIALVRAADPQLPALIAQARTTAARYSEAALEQALIPFWRRALSG